MNAVKFLRSLGCEDIEFSPEDAGEEACSRGLLVVGDMVWVSGYQGCGRRTQPLSLRCALPIYPWYSTGRSEPEFLYEVLAAVVEAGATTLNIPDTTGWTLPHEFQVGPAGRRAGGKRGPPARPCGF